MTPEYTYYRGRDAELNNYILMYNNNIAQINALQSMNCNLQNNINLIRNQQYRPRARRHHRNSGPAPPPLIVPVTDGSTSQVLPPRQSNAHGLPSSRPVPVTTPVPAPTIPTTPIQRNTLNTNRNVRTRLRDSFFDPVIIYPTQRQIENATRFVQYDTIVQPSNESCPFTCEPFNNSDMVRQILPCGHICSSAQFNTWFSSNVSCPICRCDIRNYHPIDMSNNEDLVSVAPAPLHASTHAPATATTRATPYSSLDSLLDSDITELIMRNYLLGFWNEMYGETTATSSSTATATPTATPATATTTTPATESQPTRRRPNILYYTIRNLER